MEPNYLLIYGSFKVFADNSTLKFAFCSMLVPNLLNLEFWNISKLLQIKMLVE